MSETPKVLGIKEQETPKSPFDWFSFLPKFDFRLPFPPNAAKKPPPAVVDEPRNAAAAAADKPEFVRFPKAELAVATVEAEADVSGKTSNPVVIWQVRGTSKKLANFSVAKVYALGGFLILSWAWERWKERRSRRRSNDEDKDVDEDSEDT